MKYCQNCGAEIKSGVKFCTHCGFPTKEERETKKEKLVIKDTVESKPKSSSKLLKRLLIFLALIVLAITIRSYVTNIDMSRNPMSISKNLAQLVGEWQEPTGEIFKDKETIITFRQRGDVAVGEDPNKKVYIQLLPMSSKNYSGLVVIDGVDGDYLVDYYSKENKLVFFSTLTKTSWNLLKTK